MFCYQSFHCDFNFIGVERMALIGSFACFGVVLECAASKCANAWWPLHCPSGMVHNGQVYEQ
jgi:hypothetical protein